LLFAHDGGWVGFGAVPAKVAGKAPTLVLVKSKLGLCCGYAAVPRTASGGESVSDPTGASSVFSIEAKVERFALVNKERAVRGCCIFGDGRLWICDDGTFERSDNTHAVPSEWTSGLREIRHLAQ
jgi:hypothetical protein